VVDRFLVPATPEPHISCNLRGTAEFGERDVGGEWITRQIGAGDLFVTRSRTPYEVRFESPAGQQLDNVSLHIAVEPASRLTCSDSDMFFVGGNVET
jgi:AraC family transcriptional regulator